MQEFENIRKVISFILPQIGIPLRLFLSPLPSPAEKLLQYQPGVFPICCGFYPIFTKIMPASTNPG
jgi:hypothetical protein